MSQSLEALFDPERLKERWRPVEQEQAAEEQRPLPSPLRELGALRQRLAQLGVENAGLEILLSESEALLQELFPEDEDSALEPAEREVRQQALKDLLDVVEDLLEALLLT